MALNRLVAADPQGRFRQVACVRADGRVAVHTGESCIAFAGHATGAGFSAQANMMANERVWGAMAQAYEAADGPSARRLMAALDGAEAAGGDARGRQSAAMLVVPAQGEMGSHRAARRGRSRAAGRAAPPDRRARGLRPRQQGRRRDRRRPPDGAAALPRRRRAVPDNHELLFWAGLGMAQAGDMEGGLTFVRRAIELQPGWRQPLDRLSPEIAPSAAGVAAAL